VGPCVAAAAARTAAVGDFSCSSQGIDPKAAALADTPAATSAMLNPKVAVDDVPAAACNAMLPRAAASDAQAAPKPGPRGAAESSPVADAAVDRPAPGSPAEAARASAAPGARAEALAVSTGSGQRAHRQVAVDVGIRPSFYWTEERITDEERAQVSHSALRAAALLRPVFEPCRAQLPPTPAQGEGPRRRGQV
jgi:hypothetical protein